MNDLSFVRVGIWKRIVLIFVFFVFLYFFYVCQDKMTGLSNVVWLEATRHKRIMCYDDDIRLTHNHASTWVKQRATHGIGMSLSKEVPASSK